MADRAGIICAGNWIVDLLHDIEYWPAESDLARIRAQSQGIGGGAANVIASLTKLDAGIPLWPMGAVGDDAYGDFILAECRRLGLPIETLLRKENTPTAHTHVMSVAGQSRTFFYQGGANDVLSAEDFPEGMFTGSSARLFYLGYLILLGQLDRLDANGTTDAARVLKRAQVAGLTTCVDLVSASRPDFAAIVGAAAPFIDYLILNEAEAARATGTTLASDDAHDPDVLTDLGTKLLEMGVCRAAVIHCPDTSVWVGTDGTSFVAPVQPMPPDEIVSHLGAGDAFCAGLLVGLHRGIAADRALAQANAVARASLKGGTAFEALPRLSEIEI